MIYAKRLPKLDLPETLHKEIVDCINNQNLIHTANSFVYNNKSGQTWFQKIVTVLGFRKKGKFHVHILPDELRDKIVAHYRPLIDRVGQPYKVRVKSTMNSRFLFPHSDKLTLAGKLVDGDSCSISMGVITNGETTCFYEMPPGFRYRLWNFLKLKRKASIQSSPRHAYLYNNGAIHSVYGCNPKMQRHILAISWQTVNIDDLYQAVKDVYGE